MSMFGWLFALLKTAPPTVALPERTLGEIAVERALAAWADNILDSKPDAKDGLSVQGRARIDGFIRTSGLGWRAAQDNGARVGPYLGDGTFQWCGAFAAHAWACLPIEVRAKAFASTLRLASHAKHFLIESFDDIRPGDVVVVGHKLAVGDHITIAEMPPSGDEVATVEGNATGRGPNTARMHGVVRRSRTRAEVARIYRPYLTASKG